MDKTKEYSTTYEQVYTATIKHFNAIAEAINLLAIAPKAIDMQTGSISTDQPVLWSQEEQRYIGNDRYARALAREAAKNKLKGSVR